MVEVDHHLGNPVVFALLDRRVLLSLEQVILDVRRVTGESLTFADLMRMGDWGWIPILNESTNLGIKIGIPFYVPSRIKLFLVLRHKGYSESELEVIAKWEEAWIDACLSVDGIRYIDDDLEVVIWYLKNIAPWMEKYDGDVFVAEAFKKSSAKVKQLISVCEQFQIDKVPESYKHEISSMAFSIRGFIERERISALAKYRGQIRAGYSPFIMSKTSEAMVDETFMFVPQEIDWDETIRLAIGHMQDDVPTIRVPGFLLRGDTVVSLKTLTPREYHRFWNHHDLDRYLLTWSALQGEKRCLNCLSKLLHFPSSRRMYCDDKCRNALKQKRFRLANPQAIFETQRKYWSTIDE